MENASKALIIAGAILLSILIIALGMRIYNSASSSVDDASLDGQSVQSFNATYEAYEGKQKGSAVRSLIAAVKAYNSNAAEGDKIKFDSNGIGDASSVTTNKTYYVSFTYSDDNGRITGVLISTTKPTTTT